MPVELSILAWGSVLLFLHIMLAAQARTKQYGVEWNIGPRDKELPPLNPLAGRLSRAQSNFLETYGIAIVALIGVVVAGRTSAWTAAGGWIWLGARILYLPLYAFGVRKLRSILFLVSMTGLFIALWPLLAG
ncbi:MAG TPA: MAPEG family protein [Sphingobium sp.]|uniref:MAPEG family protein n=1 Tax=Sphingobium sp. TaxID=1912891 RepID=UPI002ED618B6